MSLLFNETEKPNMTKMRLGDFRVVLAEQRTLGFLGFCFRARRARHHRRFQGCVYSERDASYRITTHTTSTQLMTVYLAREESARRALPN